MKRLSRYISSHILSATATVTLALTGLQIFILFVNQLSDMGKGNYGFLSALKVVAYQLPSQIYLFFPIASLLGVLMGLGLMANRHELVVIRAAGVSVLQITNIVIRVALILMLLVMLLGEEVLPSFNRLAVEEKTASLSGGQAIHTIYGLWLRERENFVFIERIDPKLNRMQSVLLFHFNRQHHLTYIRRIAQVDKIDGVWVATGVEQTTFKGNRTQTKHLPNMPWRGNLDTAVIQFSSLSPEEMTMRQLYQYIQTHKKLNQHVTSETLTLWHRIMQPFSTLVMMILGIPFIFGPLRSSSIGSKMLLGGCMGFGFYMLNHFAGSLSQVYQLSPLLCATLPTGLFALLGLAMLARVR